MGRTVSSVALSPTSHDLWRVAALSLMPRQAVRAAITGQEAVSWIKAAAACGLPAAQLRLGRMLLEGEGLAPDRKAAFRLFEAAAIQGDIEARNMLGRCHENGWGTTRDPAAAVREYRIAADADLDWAQYNLAHMLLAGTGIARDRNMAFIWYSRAATQGHVRAMNLVARCFEEGWGVRKSRSTALAWFGRAARGGYFRAAFNYASILEEKDCLFGALYWFARALSTAPEPTRTNMVARLGRHRRNLVRALAENFARTREPKTGCLGGG